MAILSQRHIDKGEIGKIVGEAKEGKGFKIEIITKNCQSIFKFNLDESRPRINVLERLKME